MKANRGAAGIDGVETGDFPAFMREHWEKIRGKLEAGDYKPAPVRRVSIPKDGGGTRSLGIPTVLDRLIQQAIAQVLTPLYEPLFSEHSHGFRPGRSAHDAIAEMAEEGKGKGKRCHVVDCDLQALLTRSRRPTRAPFGCSFVASVSLRSARYRRSPETPVGTAATRDRSRVTGTHPRIPEGGSDLAGGDIRGNGKGRATGWPP